MSKYYTIVYINCDSSRECRATNLIKISKNTDIYDYLARLYVKYRTAGNKKQSIYIKFNMFLSRLEHMIDSMEYDEDDITYENVYEWIKNGCSEDDFDTIDISEHRLYVVND